MRKLVVIFLCALFATQIHAGSDTASATVKAGSQEAEAVRAGAEAAMQVGLNSHLVELSAAAKVMSDTGASPERAQEIVDMVTNQLTKMGYSGSKTLSPQAKQFAEQLQAVDLALKDAADIRAIENSWAGKSVSIEGHQLGPALVKAGLLPDINRANDALKSKMGEVAYQRLHNDAYHEIDGSASQALMGANREALAGFLKLEAGDPVAAAKIFNKAVSPTTSLSFNR